MGCNSLKKVAIAFIIMVLVCASNGVLAQSFQKNAFHISAGYGIGNVWKKVLRDAFSFPVEYKVATNGPYCLLLDYALLKNASIGVALGYSETKGSGAYNGFEFRESLKTFSFLARANYHLVKFKKLDPYAGLGIGYYHFLYSNELNNNDRSKVPGNLGYSAQVGARYYFLPSVAAYMELGYIAGSVGQIGASIRL
jgi:outer membrane protein W